MQTKRDQVQAYQFLGGRLRSALLRSDPDLPETPLKRSSVGMFAGVMIAILIMVGAVLSGVFLPGASTTWRTEGAVVVDKTSGARYLYLGGTLHPVLNTASAWLVVGGPAKVKQVSAKSLAGVAHGDAVGIPGAPDTVPPPGQLTTGSWSVCSPATGGSPVLRVLIDPAPPMPLVDPGRGMLVAAPDGTLYLAWQDRRLRLPGRSAAIALGYGGTTPTPVSAGWLNALAAAADLSPPAVPGRGRPGPVLAGRATLVGQVLELRAGDTVTPYLVLPDGVAPLTRTTELLLLGDAGSAAAYPGDRVAPVQVDPVAVAAQPVSHLDIAGAGWPATPPELTDPGQTGAVPCVRVTPDRPWPRVQLAAAPAGALPAATDDGTASGSAPGDPAVVRATVPPGRGVLVRSLSAPGVGGGAVYLVTDTGRKYPVPSDAATGSLGYADVTPVPVPSMLLAMLATGPALEPAAAARVPPVSG